MTIFRNLNSVIQSNVREPSKQCSIQQAEPWLRNSSPATTVLLKFLQSINFYLEATLFFNERHFLGVENECSQRTSRRLGSLDNLFQEWMSLSNVSILYNLLGDNPQPNKIIIKTILLAHKSHLKASKNINNNLIWSLFFISRS